MGENSTQQEMYDLIRHTQIHLQELCINPEFDYSYWQKQYSALSSSIFDFKVFLKNYYIQQFFIQLSMKNITHKFDYRDVEDPTTLIKKKKKTKIQIPSFDQFILQCLKIDIQDEFTLLLYTFSIIPSYFNFFLTQSDENLFHLFLVHIQKNDFAKFLKFSSVIYFHPLFLLFCKQLFGPLFEPITYFEKDSIQNFQKNLIKNLNSMKNHFSDFISSVLMKIPFSERILHFEEYFFDQFKAFPQRFLALPYFNSVNREILEQVKEILPNILGVLINNENSEYNLKLEDSSNLIFSSFDIDKLNSSNNSGKNDGNENENEQNFYSFVTIERFDHKVEDIIENSKENKSKEFMFNLGILLQINEVLPENTIINIENSLKKVLMENLTSPSTSNSKNISRKKLFNSILDFLETLETHEFKEIVVKYEKKVPYLNDFRIRKESFEKLHTNINFLFKRFSKLILIVNTFKCEFLDFDHGYSSSFIISEPVQFQTLFNSKFPMFKGIKKIFILYQIMIRNLRFKDFCLKHQELNKYDDFFYHFINIHKDAMIERIIKSHKNLLQIDVLNNLHLFEDILIKYQKAFEINSTPYEKLNILHKYDKILRNRLIHHFPEFQEDISNAAEFLVPLQILCFILANPQKYVSNFVYIDMFYTNSSWKITNQKIRIAQDILSLISEIFYSKTLFLDFINMESFKINVYCICDEENFLSMARFLDYNGIYEIINPPRIVHKHHDLLQPFELLLFNEIISGVNYDAIVVFTKDADFITKVIKSHKSIKQRFIYCNWKSYKELKLTNSRIHYIDSDKRYNEVHNTICKVFANLNEVLEV